jgi:hypothetical protein
VAALAAHVRARSRAAGVARLGGRNRDHDGDRADARAPSRDCMRGRSPVRDRVDDGVPALAAGVAVLRLPSRGADRGAGGGAGLAHPRPSCRPRVRCPVTGADAGNARGRPAERRGHGDAWVAVFLGRRRPLACGSRPALARSAKQKKPAPWRESLQFNAIAWTLRLAPARRPASRARPAIRRSAG